MVKKIIKQLLGIKPFAPEVTVGSKNESTRVEWLTNTLKKIPNNARILDAGAGEQQFKPLCSHLTYVSQDFAQYKPADVKSGLQMDKWDYGTLDIVSDIATIPEPNASFDAVMCTEVFEHIINPRDAMKEFSRLLKKDGYLIITAPFCSLTHFAPYHFYSGFSTYFYEEELKQNNFEVVEITPNGNYFEYLAQEVRRIPDFTKKYSGVNLDAKEYKAIDDVLKLLRKSTDADTNSAEMLCFGYHILARKK
jgi:ubiquinone/menaquinone biosynthesis C-methylase UbiE